MRKEKLYREYRLKSYLNMNHYIIINGKQGQTHPHTWEFITTIIVSGNEFVEFRTFESLIEQYLEQYQNQILNNIKPFDLIVPTIENVTDYFNEELQALLREQGGELVSIEGSETPTRSYIVSHRNEPEFIEQIGKKQTEQVFSVVQYVVDQLMSDQNNKW
ncbi:6-pyruvoyl tetrahydrobiopterin synthase [Petralouisia muris]|jgi:6-pyruvoyltetrahydropterin/6-carboxytetrahydropterin synthase|uniref:6-pyruvoyl tetrahydrobiopterin synthase n=1 Tax=Petralouisia muris TaxID=3032872 RepID=A0AC61RVL2_9FIRM|nr:6-carboxytetrahydropterin synthase [Petralouisia muris]TGY95665.1 6-pyruvoyl tetrahydrobiopterin synthase [Petralouisia muris]